MKNSPSCHQNQTGVDCGWPDGLTVVSHTIASVRRRSVAAAWAGLP